MRPEEITADIPEEKTPEDDHKEYVAPEETIQEESPEETDLEDDPEETDQDQEDAPEETDTEEISSEETSTEETTQEKTAAKKDTIQDREETLKPSSEELSTEYLSPVSDLEYDVFEQILAEQQTTNTLLVRITNQNDLFLGIGVTLIICCICYSVLERFTRF